MLAAARIFDEEVVKSETKELPEAVVTFFTDDRGRGVGAPTILTSLSSFNSSES